MTSTESSQPLNYADAYAESLSDPTGFWLNAAGAIDWDIQPTQACDDTSTPSGRWFPDGRMNTAFNALDRHVYAGRGEQLALVYDSAMVPTKATYTYAELLREVELFAGVLTSRGVTTGDRVIIYMPMIPEAVIAMLACARIGAVHSVVFGGFAAHELAARVDDAEPVLMVTASGGIEPGKTVEYLPIVARALSMSGPSVRSVVVKYREQIEGAGLRGEATSTAAWLDWDEEMATASPEPCVSMAANDPLYILYTSGTTGKPKGVVRDNGGHAVAMAWSMKYVYDIGPGQVWWAASDVGWVVGHSYIVYAPLLVGATTILYEGKPVGTPDAGAFWRIASEYGVSAIFTAPTALRAIRKVDPDAAEVRKYDLTALHTLFLAGERLDPDTYQWATSVLDRPVVDHWWQTETGWAICANLRGMALMPVKAGSPTVPCPGYRVEVVDDHGEAVPNGQEGSIVVRLPLPPGALMGLWRDECRFAASYLSAFDGAYNTGDSGYFDEDGYLFVLGRSDDVINVAGHRLSTGGMEAVVAGHPAVAECAVVGIHDDLKGQRPVGYVVLKSGADVDPRDLQRDLVSRVRDQIGAVASFHDVTVVAGLPKTRSGKILRKTMRQIVDGSEYAVPSTIEDVDVLDDFARVVGVSRSGTDLV